MLSRYRINRINLLSFIVFATFIGGCGNEPPPAKTANGSTSPSNVEGQPPAGDVLIAQLKSKADKGDADAMFQLSELYRHGEGVDANRSLADSLLEQAATLNHPEALYELAIRHSMEIDLALVDGATKKDRIRSAENLYTESVRLFERAIGLGHKGAEEQLALLTLIGLDDLVHKIGATPAEVSKNFRGDVSRALPHFEQAASEGSAQAMVAMYRIYKEKKWGRQSSELAAVWLAKLDAVSDPKKVADIGDLLYRGFLADKPQNIFDPYDPSNFKPVPERVTESQPFIERAAKGGVTGSQLLLSRILLGGFNGFRSPTEAATWLKKASDAGSSEAQVTLGRLYMTGDGVLQDFSAAVKLFGQAAMSSINTKKDGQWIVVEPKVWEAQYLLGVLNEKGLGVQKDMVRAHAWYNIAATNGFKKAVPARNALTPQLTVDQLAEAQELAKNWKPGSNSLTGVPAEKSGASAAAGGHAVKVGTGTIFIVSKAGHAITNQHVAGGCSELRVQGRDGLAKLLNEDKVNDLALVQLQGTVIAAATITAEPGKLRQGEDVAAFGFPLNSVLSSGGNLTPGVVSALTGVGNNVNQIQITAPIQPGSSGSPVLNKKGEVVGVVVMKLDDTKMARATGQIGQNINFAISGQTLKTFLDTHKVSYSTGGGFFSREKSAADLADEARKWTLVVECWK